MVARETNLVNAFETTLVAQLASGGTTMQLTANPGVDSPAYFVIDPDNDSNREVVLWSTGTDHSNATVTRDMDGKHVWMSADTLNLRSKSEKRSKPSWNL